LASKYSHNMGIFSDSQKLKTALEVIENDRRTKSQYESKEQNRHLKNLLATLVAVLVLGAILLMLPKNGKSVETTIKIQKTK